jgi:glycosyltransferase involved in cell wall biosynthesis
MKKIGLVTITFNSAHVIEPFMQCVLAQTHTHFVLYIIDNISSDNTLESLTMKEFLSSQIQQTLVLLPETIRE